MSKGRLTVNIALTFEQSVSLYSLAVVTMMQGMGASMDHNGEWVMPTSSPIKPLKVADDDNSAAALCVRIFKAQCVALSQAGYSEAKIAEMLQADGESVKSAIEQ